MSKYHEFLLGSESTLGKLVGQDLSPLQSRGRESVENGRLLKDAVRGVCSFISLASGPADSCLQCSLNFPYFFCPTHQHPVYWL